MTKLHRQPLDRLLRDAIAAGVAPGIVAGVARRTGVEYLAAVGARCSDPRLDMETDSVFRIASMTKLVTSLAVMMLVEEGKIELDAPFAEYVPGYRQPDVLESFDAATKRYATRPAEAPVTVRGLLAHTAGYGYWFLDAPLLALTRGAPELFDPPFLMHAPGRKFAYSSGTDVLGRLFEPVTGMALETFFAERIFGPLGMADTGYSVPADGARLVTVHARAGGPLEERPNETRGEAPRGGGGLYSTAPDYLRLLRLLLNGGELDGRRLVARALAEAIAANQIGALHAEPQRTALPERSNDFIFMDGSQKFGCGVMIETRTQATGRAAGTFSWGGIYNTYFWVDPRAGIAAVVLMQTAPFADPLSVDFYARFERAVYDCSGRVPG